MTMAETSTRSCTDPVILNQWHAVADLDEIRRGPLHTLLLGEPLTCWIDDDGTARAEAPPGASWRSAPTTASFGPPWVSPTATSSVFQRPRRTTGGPSTP